jgi:hypothetical protein
MTCTLQKNELRLVISALHRIVRATTRRFQVSLLSGKPREIKKLNTSESYPLCCRRLIGLSALASKVDFLDTAHGRDFRRFATYSGKVQQIQALDQKRLLGNARNNQEKPALNPEAP